MGNINIILISLWLLCAAPTATEAKAAATNAPPVRPKYNVILLIADQHRPDALGRYGDINAITPALDSLAASGFSFRQDYCQSPKCIPSRYCMLLGRYEHSVGRYQLHGDVRANLSFAQVLRANGYIAACFGKLHTPNREDLDWDILKSGREGARKKGNAPPGSVIIGGLFDGHDHKPIGAPSPYPDTALPATQEWNTKEDTIAFMKANLRHPWVIECSLHAPHPPFQPPLKYWNLIDPAHLKVTPYPKNDLDDGNPRYGTEMVKRGMDHLTDEQILGGMRGYYGNLAFADAMFAEVLNALDDLGLRDNTLVIYTSDHGEMLGTHRLWGKEVFFDSSVRVPLIMRLPGVIPAGKESRALVESIDIYPTMMDLLGLKTPASVQGKSLVPVLTGKTETHRGVVRSEFPNSESDGKAGMSLMQFDGRYKVVDNGPGFPPELYDLQTDPLEINNLQAKPEYHERLQKTLAELHAWEQTDVAQPTVKNKSTGNSKAARD